MQKTLVATFDHENEGLEELTHITLETPIAVAPKWHINDEGEEILFGYNVYALDIENGTFELLETYDTQLQAEFVQSRIIEVSRTQQSLVIL